MAPTILLIAGYVWFTRRQMGGFTGTAGGGRGLFNVGKAQVSVRTIRYKWLLRYTPKRHLFSNNTCACLVPESSSPPL